MTVKNLGLVQAIWKGTTAPSNTAMIWYDTNIFLHKYYDLVTSAWVPFTLNSAELPLVRIAGSISLYYDVDQFELVGGYLTIKADVLASVTPPFPISDITGLQTALDSKVDKVTGKSLILDSEITRLSTVIQYTHPDSVVIAGEYKAFTIDQYGHIIAVNDAAVVHIADTETITGDKTFTALTTNFLRIYANIDGVGDLINESAILGKANAVGIEGWGTGITSIGVLGRSENIPVEAKSLATTASNHPCLLLSGDVSTTASAVDYGLGLRWDLPSERLISLERVNTTAGTQSCLWTDTTVDLEKSRFEWWLLNEGVFEKKMQLDNDGKLSVSKLNLSGNSIGRFLKLDNDKNVVSSELETVVYTLRLPVSGTVIGRCDAAVEGTDYPTGWILGAYDLNPNDLVITHNLDRHIVDVTVFSFIGTEERKLISNAAYAGIIAPDMNSVRVENLATVPTDLLVHVTLSNRVNV